MKVPSSCEDWETKLKASSQGQAILTKILGENCISEDVEKEFFKDVAARGPPKDAEEAVGFAVDAVQDRKDDLTCCGKPVPGRLFRRVMRLEKLSYLKYRIPPSRRGQLLYRCGIVEKRFVEGKISRNQATRLVRYYEGPVTLGDRIGVVWITTSDESTRQMLDDLANLIDRLGLPELKAERFCLVFEYERSVTKRTLHVPRAFDGIGNPQFEAVPDCDADSGMTRPVEFPPEQGLPEAIHKHCELANGSEIMIEVREI